MVAPTAVTAVVAMVRDLDLNAVGLSALLKEDFAVSWMAKTSTARTGDSLVGKTVELMGIHWVGKRAFVTAAM